MAGLDRVGAALGADHRCVAEKPGDPRPVERRRHHDEAQILAQAALRVERQRKPEIGVEGALVELVEQHRRDALDRGIVEHHAGEHAVGDDLDARPAPDLRAEPDPQADGLADRLAERAGHAVGGGARGEAPRLEDDQLAALDPGLVEKRQRHPRGLSGAGRRDQHRVRSRRERRREIGQRLVDGKRHVEGAHGRDMA